MTTRIRSNPVAGEKGTFPVHGWLGLGLIIIFWALNWTLSGPRTHWGFFPMWLGFKGGKGVATTIGVLFGLFWPLGLIFIAVWLAMAFLFRFQMWAFALGQSPWTDLFRVDILNAMGLGIIVLAPLAVFETRDPRMRHSRR